MCMVQFFQLSDSPGLTSLHFQLVYPCLVNIHWTGVDYERLVLHDLLHHGRQELAQGVLPASASVEADNHLNDSGVSSDNVLNLVYLGAASGTEQCQGLGFFSSLSRSG